MKIVKIFIPNEPENTSSPAPNKDEDPFASEFASQNYDSNTNSIHDISLK